MIEIDLAMAILVYSGVLAVIVGAIWIYTELSVRRPQQYLGKQFLWRCTICGLSYLDEEATRMSQCPRCESYNIAEEAQRSHRPVAVQAAAEDEPRDRPRRSGSKGKRQGQRHRGGRRRR